MQARRCYICRSVDALQQRWTHDSNMDRGSNSYNVMSSARGLWVQQSGSQLLVAALSMLLVTLIVLYVNLSLQRRRKLPPGPWPWPILGNVPNIAATDLPHRSLHALAAKFGGLMYLRLGSQPCIVVSTVAVAKEIFQTNDAIFSSRPTRLYWTIFSGNTDDKSLAGAPYGPYWRQLRKLCNTELFSPRRHASYQKVRTEEVHDMVRVLLEESRKQKAVNLNPILYGVTANTVIRMLINKRYFGDGVKDQKEKEDLELLIERTLAAFSTFVISDYVPFLSFITKLQGIHADFEDLHKSHAAVTSRMFEVENHRQRAKERLQNNDKDYVPNFVDLLLAAPLDDEKPLPDKDIILVLMDVLNGGTGTSSTTVEWAISELMLHPDVLKRAQDELDIVVGAERIVQESDIPKLPYLQAIIKEVFRLHPAVALALPRQSTKASNCLGFSLPAHTHLILNLFAIHRDPSVYENPDTFNPDRFVDHPEVKQTSGFDSYELIPFSAGRRMCPAFTLGNLMVSLLLAHLLHSFNWSLPEGQSAESFDMSESFALTVGRKTPLCLVV